MMLKCSIRLRGISKSIGALAVLLISAHAFAGPLDTLPVGHWYAFPNSQMSSVAPSPAPSGSVAAVMNAWSGGVYDTDRDQLVIWGGGHTDYAGNEVYAFGPLTADSPTWHRLTNPSTPPADNTPRGSDGRPVSRHTYNLLAYMPAPYNKMASCAVGSEYSNGYGVGGMDFYNFTVDGMTGQPWSAGPTAPSNAYPLEAYCAYNPVTQRLWYQDNHSNQARLQEYNATTNSWASHVVFSPETQATAAIDTKRNLMVVAGGGKVYVYNLNSPDSTPIAAATSGPTAIQGAGFPGFVYDPVNDQFVGWSGGTAVYALSIPSTAPSGTWAWSQITTDTSVSAGAVAGSSYATGTFGRFRYVPSRQGVIVVSAIDQSVYFLKLPNNGGKPLPAVNISANPTSVPVQGTATVSWSTTNAATCTASGAWSGSKGTSGTASAGPLATSSTYTLTCDNGSGGTNSGTVTVQVATGTPAPTVTFAANPTAVLTNGTSQLTWTTANASSCTGSGAWSGSKATSGSLSIGPLAATATYTLTCSGSGGTTASNAAVTVSGALPAPVVMLTAGPTSVASGGNSTLTWSATNASSCTASAGWTGTKSTQGNQSVGPLTANASFVLTCTGSGGSSQSTAAVTIASSGTPGAAPTVSLTATPSSIGMNGSSMLSWSSTNATACSASNGWSGSMPVSGSQSTGALTTTTNYTLSCTGAGGTAQKSVTIGVSSEASTTPASASSSSGGGGSLESLSLLTLLLMLAARQVVDTRLRRHNGPQR